MHSMLSPFLFLFLLMAKQIGLALRDIEVNRYSGPFSYLFSGRSDELYDAIEDGSDGVESVRAGV